MRILQLTPGEFDNLCSNVIALEWIPDDVLTYILADVFNCLEKYAYEDNSYN